MREYDKKVEPVTDTPVQSPKVDIHEMIDRWCEKATETMNRFAQMAKDINLYFETGSFLSTITDCPMTCPRCGHRLY